MKVILQAPTSRLIDRTHRRFPVCYAVTYSSGSTMGQGVVVNVSGGGWKISGDIPLKAGMTVQLEMTCGPHEPSIRIERAIVHWAQGRDFGIRVDRVKPSAQMQLKQLIMRLACQ